MVFVTWQPSFFKPDLDRIAFVESASDKAPYPFFHWKYSRWLDQLRTDVLAFWINMGEKKAKPHHCKHKKRKSENGNCLAAPAIWSISSGKMGRELCRKLIPQKQSDQDRA